MRRLAGNNGSTPADSPQVIAVVGGNTAGRLQNEEAIRKLNGFRPTCSAAQKYWAE